MKRLVFHFICILFVVVENSYTTDLLGVEKSNNSIGQKPLGYGHFTFHELGQLSQVNKTGYKIVKIYFNTIPDVKEYLEKLFDINLVDLPITNEKKILNLAQLGATYKPCVRRWILNYAINYISNHYLTLYEKQTEFERGIGPRFIEWIYIVRTFQTSDENFDADTYVNYALMAHLSCYRSLLYDEFKKSENFKRYINKSNPKLMIQNLQRNSFSILKYEKECFRKDQDPFNIMLVYYQTQELYNGCLSHLYNTKIGGDSLVFKSCLYALCMRGAKNQLIALICKLYNDRAQMIGERKDCWVYSASLFLEIYRLWKIECKSDDFDVSNRLWEIHKHLESYNHNVSVMIRKQGVKAQHKKAR